jgi:hypothetical protein
MNRIITLLILSLLQLSVYAQVRGRVVDKENAPIEFANITLHVLPDSTLITGTVSDREGRFNIQSNFIKNAFLRVSMVGYQTEYIPITNLDQDTITLSDISQQLNEVIITATPPSYKMDAEGLNTKIENTVFSNLGTAVDILGQLPFVSIIDDNFTVFGRGTPLIYINNRLLQNNEELKQLKSSDVKEVKVILNPCSQYDASVGSVIRITTIKPVGEGLSASVYTMLRQRRNFDHYEYIDFNYRKQKIDFFARLGYNGTKYQQNQKTEESLYLDKAYTTRENFQIKSDRNSWDATAGLNYSFSPVHSMGIRYQYSGNPKYKWESIGNTLHYINEINDDNFTFVSPLESNSNRNYVNIYYHNELPNNTVMHFEGDLVNGGSSTDQSSNYNNTVTSENILVNSHSETDYALYAGKLTVEQPLFGGKIVYGGEGSYTDNRQQFEMLNEEVAQDLPSNHDKNEQQLWAAFLSYEHSWNYFSLNAGLRYEHINFKYYYDDQYREEQSRIYNNCFPSVALSYRKGSINMSLSDKTTVRRPNYFNLRSAISYNSPYNYEGGNPSLKPMYINKLTYLAGWKDLQLEVSYNWIKDNLLFVGRQFEDKPIVLFMMENLPYCEQLDMYVSYSPQIDIWKPTFTLGFDKQNLKYQNRSYNKPYYSYAWNNIFQFPNNFQFIINMRGNLNGNNNIILNKSGFRTDIRVSKKFLDDKLHLILSATDIFSTNLERWSMTTNNMYEDKWNDSDNRGINLQIIYKFNSTQDKYKGRGATNEINRL